jgi:hypothetical protein
VNYQLATVGGLTVVALFAHVFSGVRQSLSVESACALAQAAAVRTLSVDMPHGSCRLTVSQDGEASVSFGAMPRWIQVTPHAFNFEHLAKSLRDKSHLHRAHNNAERPYGGLSFSDSSTVLFIYDHKLIRSAIERAWRARVAPKTPREIEDYAWVSKACALL